MSKSDADDGTRINLTDSATNIRDKMRRAKTDSVTGFTFDPVNRPEKSNLIVLLAIATGRSVMDVAAVYSDSSALAFKEEAAEALIRVVCPIGERVSLGCPEHELPRSQLPPSSADGRAARRSTCD